jgi:hypothetical protein
MIDMTMRAGETLTVDSQVTNADGSPRDISGAAVSFSVWDGPALGSLEVVGTGVVTNGPAGDITAYLIDSATDEYAGQRHVFYYKISLTEVNGTETVIEDGKLIIQ